MMTFSPVTTGPHLVAHRPQPRQLNVGIDWDYALITVNPTSPKCVPRRPQPSVLPRGPDTD